MLTSSSVLLTTESIYGKDKCSYCTVNSAIQKSAIPKKIKIKKCYQSLACNVQFRFPEQGYLWNLKPEEKPHLTKDMHYTNRVSLSHCGSRHWQEELKTINLGHIAFMLLHEKAVCMLKDSSWEYDKFIHFHPENKSVTLGRKLSCFQSLLCVFSGIFFRFCLLIVWCSFLGSESFT